MSARGACSSLLNITRGAAQIRQPGRLGVTAVHSQLQPVKVVILLRPASQISAGQRWMSSQSTASSTSAAGATSGEGAGDKGTGKEGAGTQGGQKAGAEEIPFDEYDVQEPFVARASRIIWTTIKFSAGVGFLGGLVYAGYTIVTTLLPVGASPNAIMRRATDILVHDPDLVASYGSVKTYGLDPGGRAEGRRYFVPEYKYEDTLTGDKYHRVKFNLEGDRNRKAWVYAEVNSSTGDFRYLIVVAKDGSRVVSVVDRRPPPMTKEDRTSRVTSLIQDANWAFYADNDADSKDQARVLGEYWLKVKCVRCDESAERCAEAGVVGSTPAWVTFSGVSKGVKGLDDLERMVQPLARAKEKGASGKGFFG